MTIETGQHLLHYRVTAKLGEGGMGVVWKALDTTLDREVAIKVLPAGFTADPERLARFEREAKVLASLNHSNIAGIYGLHEVPADAPGAEPLRFIAMEFVSGEDLAARLQRGPLPVDAAVDIAITVADALSTAHGNGVVHRDLKPANVMLTTDDVPKVLDFGLAKAMGPDGASGSAVSAEMSPTVTSLGTVAGVILGTAAYMSPEQARGRSVDRRADIWALGAMLYQMLTGRTPFPGETISDTLAAVLKSEPDWDALPATTPPALRRLLRRCLEKNLKERLHDAADVRIELAHVFDDADATTVVAADSSPARSRIVVAVVGALALIVGALFGMAFRGSDTPATTASRIVSSIEAPDGISLNVAAMSLAISPSGDRVAFVGVDEVGVSRLYVRPLDVEDARRLEGTEGAATPFWSPDGLELGYHTGASLMRLAVDGGQPRLVTEQAGRDGAWNREGTILFGSQQKGPIWRVNADGGKATPIEATSPGPGVCAMAPQFLPDGNQYIFHLEDLGGDRSGIYLTDLESSRMIRLVDGIWSASYAEGQLLYQRSGVLVAQPLDIAAGKLTGEPRKIVEGLLTMNYPFHAFLTVAPTGDRIAFLRGEESVAVAEAVWVDRTGAELEQTGVSGDLYNPRLSNDDRRLAIDISTNETNGDIWVFDLARGSSRRLTRDPIDESRPVWIRDESQIVYFKVPDLYSIDVAGTSEPEPLVESPSYKAPNDISPDGRHILYYERIDGQADFRVLDLQTRETRSWISSEATEMDGRFSPDGRWVAFVSDESGRLEVYLDRFPEPGERFRISQDGGRWPVWRGDGKELFFIDGAGNMKSVALDMDREREPIGSEQKLFFPRLYGNYFDVSADGQRFLLIERIDPEVRSIVLIQNWTEAAGVN